MPQAPDYATLYDIATAIETTFQTLLRGLDIPTFIQRETDTLDDAGNQVPLPAERVDVQFTLGQWNGRWGITNDPHPTRPGQRLLAHSGWSYSLRFEVRTNRLPTDRGRHARIVAQIRALIQQSVTGQYFIGLPFHALPSINCQNAAPQISIDDDQDVSPLTFTGVVTIRSDAWPPAPAAPVPDIVYNILTEDGQVIETEDGQNITTE